MDQQELRDNPFWPIESAVEKAKDKAADLPLPKVSGAEWLLSPHDIECLAAGAGILASGGGGDVEHGQYRALQVLKEGKEVKVVNPCRLDAEKMGLVCTIALMGDPMAEKEGDKNEGSLLAVKRLQQVLAGENQYNVSADTCSTAGGTFTAHVASPEDLNNISVDYSMPLSNQITGLTAVETGAINIIEPLCTSASSGLPSLDVAGQGRSYPKLEMYMPFIYGCKYCPAALADMKKNTVTCVGVGSVQELELFLRDQTVSMGELSSIAMGLMPFEAIFSKMVLFATSRAWQLGRAVVRAFKTHDSILDTIIEHQKGILLLKGKVTHVESKSGGGFNENICSIEGLEKFAGYFVKVYAQNENYAVKKVDSNGEVLEVLATIPDIISVINLETSKPLDVPVMAGKKLPDGLMVAVVILPASPLLYTPKALKVVGPRALGLDMDYRDPQILKPL